MSEKNVQKKQMPDTATMIEMRKSGMNNVRIGKALGVSETYIYSRIGSYYGDNEALGQTKPTPAMEKQIKRLRNGLKTGGRKAKETPELKINDTTEIPGNITSEKKSDTSAVNDVQPAITTPKVAVPKESTLKIVSARYELDGTVGRYMIDTEKGTVDVSGDTLLGTVHFSALDTLLTEFEEIKQFVGNNQFKG